ncbi:hypothetical protein [Kiloniella sp. EL199]|uniref:hypothetical protein n=1 Tax=Kiloniella sp. EL199 TaxID=2107581 RepID=UPI000EA3285F|nr:hypothetical protein [Kiloniella sp. EL199]
MCSDHRKSYVPKKSYLKKLVPVLVFTSLFGCGESEQPGYHYKGEQYASFAKSLAIDFIAVNDMEISEKTGATDLTGTGQKLVFKLHVSIGDGMPDIPEKVTISDVSVYTKDWEVNAILPDGADKLVLNKISSERYVADFYGEGAYIIQSKDEDAKASVVTTMLFPDGSEQQNKLVLRLKSWPLDQGGFIYSWMNFWRIFGFYR